MAVTITADQVKKLRDQTGAGMMECKAALTEANGEVEQAITILRTRGLASAAKKAGRATSEGLIAHWLSDDHTHGILAEINCESDFVARTDDFQQLMAGVLTDIRNAGERATETWLKDSAGPIQQRLTGLIAKLGENMAVPRFVQYDGQGYVGQYIHLGGKTAVQVELIGVTPEVAAQEPFTTLVKEVAMQIAAASPLYASREAVPMEVIEKERAIYRAQIEGSGKPAPVIEKIVEGKLGSFYSQFVLGDQPYIRDPKTTVANVIATANKTLGLHTRVARFTRLKVGEAA